MEASLFILSIGILVFLAHVFESLFKRTRIPDVLLLILLGIIIGPLGKIILPGDFGRVGSIFTTVTLVVILFESGLGLRIDTVWKALSGTAKIVFLGFITTMTVTGLFIWGTCDIGISPGIHGRGHSRRHILGRCHPDDPPPAPWGRVGEYPPPRIRGN
ncbi:MAG: cation:proton antiporter [Marinilabiliales bacterium]|nr:cation:proton antiporter [Marinilabiliales bacterium]